MIQEDVMRRTTASSARPLVRRFAPIACVAVLGVSVAACGSSDKPGNTTPAPAVTTTPSGATTTPATTAPKSGVAGF